MIEVERYIETSITKIKSMKNSAGDCFPSYGYTEDGKYKFTPEGSWVDGFFPGMLYLAYEETGDDWFLNAARDYDKGFNVKAGEKLSIQDHDLGFMFSLKDVFDYRITNSNFYKERALIAANALLKRYNPMIGIIPAWEYHYFEPDADYKGRIICDTMMNLPLLMWAYSETNDEIFKKAAVDHATNAAMHLIREDGSSYHVFDFDSKTGKPKSGKTMQGYSDDSCWARGQAWLVYGFALMYRNTGIELFLDSAEKTANYFISHLSAYKLPVWDFAVSELEFRPWDASAGACAVCGLLEIAKFKKNEDIASYYKKSADELMHSLIYLCSTMYIPELEPLLLHVSGAPIYRKGSENTLMFANGDTAIIFGDYYFFEALMRYKHNDIILPWSNLESNIYY